MKKLLFVLVVVAAFALATIAVKPVFAQEPTPPAESSEVVVSDPVEPPSFDWAKISSALSDLLTAFLLPTIAFAARWMYAKGNAEYSRLTEAQKEMFRAYLKTAIFAAEQLNLKDKVVSKLDYVVELAQTYLAQNRIEMPLVDIKLEVEAIIARELNLGKILAPKAGTLHING